MVDEPKNPYEDSKIESESSSDPKETTKDQTWSQACVQVLLFVIALIVLWLGFSSLLAYLF